MARMSACILCSLLAPQAWADQSTTTAPWWNPNQSVSASARLDFILNIGKFIFFRVGTGAFPTASGTVDTVSFNAVPAIPAIPFGAVVPANGNGTPVSWNGTAPVFSAASTTLPVEVRSNAGQVSIRATASVPLTSGANSIPLSQIVVMSSDSNLPAPAIPDSGTGMPVTVAGTAFSNLVTLRSADWKFSYIHPTAPAAGNYSGQVSFTAASP